MTYFVMYPSQYDLWLKLNITERGELITAIYEYAGERPRSVKMSDRAEMLFFTIVAQLDRDAAKYQAKCDKRRAAIEKRWANGEKNATKSEGSPKEPKDAPKYSIINTSKALEYAIKRSYTDAEDDNT